MAHQYPCDAVTDSQTVSVRVGVCAKVSAMEDLLFVLRGIRNGAYYGTKIRAPHAAGVVMFCRFRPLHAMSPMPPACCVAVMTFLFRSGPLREKIDSIVRLTFEHTVRLAKFVGVYKALLMVGRWLAQAAGFCLDAKPGLPAHPLHAFLAGCIGALLPSCNVSCGHPRP